MNKKTLALSKLKPVLEYHKDVYYADIETVVIENIHYPIAISIIKNDSNKIYTYIIEYTDDLKVLEDKFTAYLRNVLKIAKYSTIYFHNFSRFDGLIILQHLFKIYESNQISIIERNNVIYEIKVDNINIKDTYLMLNIKLSQIAEYFNKKYKKINFDYPDIKTIWKNNPKKIKELIEMDVKTLAEGFENYVNYIIKFYNCNIHNKLSIASIAFTIFRSKYYNYPNIWKNTLEDDIFIRRSYIGGINEVYIPYGKDLYYYDINSLYPFAMTKKMPIGKPKKIKGEDIILDDFFGFIEAKIESPQDIKIPFLPVKSNNNSTIISPIGTWISVYFSEELKEAKKLGYIITPIKGLQYNKGYPLKKYVYELYKERIKYPKTHPMNLITKLLLNSLYGRFGMKLMPEKKKFLNLQELEYYKQHYTITNITKIKGTEIYNVSYNNTSLLTNVNQKYKTQQDLTNAINIISTNTNTAVQIASAITSYSRIHMYKYKTIKGNKCLYTDTDSVFLEKPLSGKLISDKLGSMKLETKIKEAIFLAPKCYTYKDYNDNIKIVFKGLNDQNISFEFMKQNLHIDQTPYIYNRINNFKRDLNNFKLSVIKSNIQFSFNLTKRHKIYDSQNYWIDTKPIKIHSINSKDQYEIIYNNNYSIEYY